MMKKLILISAILIVVPIGLMAGKLKVKFVDQDKKTVSEAQAKVVEKSSGKEFPGKAGKKGETEFDKLDAGEYQVVAHAQGHMMSKSNWVTVGDKEASLTMTLVLEAFYRNKESEGNTALTEGKFAQAIERYKELLDLVPNEGVLWSNLAKAYVGVREPNKAREAAQKASSIDPEQYGKLEAQINGWLSLEEGRQALESQNFPKAVEALTAALAVDSNNAEAYYALALAYGHQKKYPEALKNIDAALNLKPDDSGFKEVKRILTHNAEVAAGK
jgi:tetratricopeptide (TPR) repeat protein